MRNQKGVTIIELLIVVAIIGIIAAIAIPSLVRANETRRGMADFKVYFGVTLPAGDLDEGQKAVLRPFVAKRLDELSTATQRDNKAVVDLRHLPDAQDASQVQERLDAFTKADVVSRASQADYTRAKFAAELRGLE